MATYEEAFNAKTARGAAARKKYGGDLAKFTDAAKAYNTKQAASKKKNVVIDDQGNKGNPSGTGPGPIKTASPSSTPGGNVPMGSAEDIAELKALNPTSGPDPIKTRNFKESLKVGGKTYSGSDVDQFNKPSSISKEDQDFVSSYNRKKHGTDTRQNASMANTIANAGASKQKNISRGHYTGDQTATTSEGSLKIDGKVTPVTTTETYGNITKPKGSIDKSGNKISSTGTGFIPQGKGSTVTSYKTDMPDAKPEFESRASTIGDSSTRSRWSKGANNIFLQNPTLKSGYQGVQEQKNYGQISKREHSKLQAKNVLGADASKKQLRQKGRDIRKTGRATDKRNKSDERLREKEIAADARLGLDLSSASKRDPSKTNSARKKVNDLSLLSQNKINKNIV